MFCEKKVTAHSEMCTSILELDFSKKSLLSAALPCKYNSTSAEGYDEMFQVSASYF